MSVNWKTLTQSVLTGTAASVCASRRQARRSALGERMEPDGRASRREFLFVPNAGTADDKTHVHRSPYRLESRSLSRTS